MSLVEKRRLVPVVVLTMIMFLSFSLTLVPVLATRGSYPGVNGKIVFQAGSPKQIYVMNPDGTDWKPLGLKDPPQDNYDPVWSLDGTKILFHRYGISGFQDGVYVMNANGSDEKQLISGALDPCWSPDGSKIAFSYEPNNKGIWLMSAADGTVLDQLTDNAADIQPNWSPDGTKIVFARGARDYGLRSIYVVNADGSGTPTELTPWTHNVEAGVRAPDWQRLSPPVGGFMEPVSTFAIFAPWLAAMGLVGCMATAVVVVRKRFDS